MIAPTLQSQIAQSMKARDKIRLSTLQMLSSAFNYKRIELQHELSQEEELAVVRAEAKKRRDAIEAYQKAARQDLLEKEEAELKILKEFLPPELSDPELEKIVAEAISETGASSLADVGRVIGEVMKRTKGQASGARVSELVKKNLA